MFGTTALLEALAILFSPAPTTPTLCSEPAHYLPFLSIATPAPVPTTISLPIASLPHFHPADCLVWATFCLCPYINLISTLCFPPVLEQVNHCSTSLSLAIATSPSHLLFQPPLVSPSRPFRVFIWLIVSSWLLLLLQLSRLLSSHCLFNAIPVDWSLAYSP